MKSSLILCGLAILLLSDISYAKKKILVTSFEAFSGREKNNSSLVSEELKRLFEDHPDLSEDYSLEFVVLPVQARTAAAKARQHIDKMNPPPELVLSLGESPDLARQSKAIEINFLGFNRQSSKIHPQDNRNVSWDTSRNGKIYPYWEDSARFSFPIAQMYCALNDVDKKWIALSDSIGSYVCNDTAFDLALYLRDQNEKDSTARSLSYPYENSKRREVDALRKTSEETLKKMNEDLKIPQAEVDRLKSEIDRDPFLRGKLPELYELMESEKGGYRRSNSDSRQQQRQNSHYGQERYGGGSPVYNTKTNLWEYRSNSSTNTPQPSDYKPYPGTDTRYTYPRAPPHTAEPQRILPQELINYKLALERLERDTHQIKNKQQDFTNQIRSIENRYDSVIRSITNIANDSILSSKKPMYGFIHIPILASSKNTNPLDIAQVIAIMIKGSFDRNFHYARVDYTSGKVECGLDSRFVQSPAYQKVALELSALESKKEDAKSRFHAKLPKEEAISWSDDEIQKLARKSKYKNDPDAQEFLSLLPQISIKNAELAAVIKLAPQPHSNRESYFKGHEKYADQGLFQHDVALSDHLLRLTFDTQNKDVIVPGEIDFKVKTDSNGNIVLLIKDEFGREQLVDLSNFESNTLTLASLSHRSSLSIRLDATKSYSKYELRDLKADGVRYSELNSKVKYWMIMDFTYPVIRTRSEPYQVEKFDYKGKKYNAIEYRNVQYWDTTGTRYNILLSRKNSKWNFSLQDRIFNTLQMNLDKNAERLTYISNIQLFDIPQVVPQTPITTAQK